MNFIEITQDGAGIVKNNDFDIDGIITDSVETCLVYIFYGTESFSLIHDTAQLKISEICNVVKKCGEITSSFYALNPNELNKLSKEHKKLQIDAHKKRRERIKNLLNLKRITKIEIPTGRVSCMKDKRIFTNDEYIENCAINKIPKRKVRESINKLNNLFLPNNAQSLNVDLQFDGVSYTELPRLLKTKEEMINIAELNKGEFDYFPFLREAEKIGLF